MNLVWNYWAAQVDHKTSIEDQIVTFHTTNWINTQAWMWNTGVYLLAHLYYNLQSSHTGFNPQSQMTTEEKKNSSDRARRTQLQRARGIKAEATDNERTRSLYSIPGVWGKWLFLNVTQSHLMIWYNPQLLLPWPPDGAQSLTSCRKEPITATEMSRVKG